MWTRLKKKKKVRNVFLEVRRKQLGYKGNKDSFSVTLGKKCEKEISVKRKENETKKVGGNAVETNGD